MAPLSKDTSGVILPFGISKILLNASNKIVNMEHKIKNFKVAGEILAGIWSELIIDGHPIKMAYIDTEECSIDNRIRKMEESSCTAIEVHATNS